MSTDSSALQRRSDDLHSRYRYAFGGKPRITRSLAALDEIIEAARALVAEGAKLSGAADVVAALNERVELYERERVAIVDAQKAGPSAVRATILGSRANGWFSVYGRHFAGKSRHTRDIALLDDIIDVLRDIESDLRVLLESDARDMAESQLEPVQRNIEMYVEERQAILDARAGDASVQTSVYANLANAQFDIYRVHFAGRQRLSRHIPLLERAVGVLEMCQSGMQKLVDAGHPDNNEKNLEIVQQRLESYRRELDALRTARQNASVFDVIDALGQSANVVMEEYAANFAGQNRATRDLDLLGGLIDRLLQTERQMWALSQVHDNPANERNVGIVHDTLIVYLAEYERIQEAKQ